MHTDQKVHMAELLLARSEVVDTGCRRWRGRSATNGYGQVTVNGRTWQVHRLAYEVWIGPIPDGLEVDHVYAKGCRYRDCIEPQHLEAVTHRENVLRMRRPSRCPKGHEFTPENTEFSRRKNRPGPARRCIQCRLERTRKYRAKQRRS